jgi:hypothetical protein
MGDSKWLRAVVLIVALAAAAFWVYSIYYLIANASPTGGGMELVAIVPMTIVFAALTLPALLIARKGRHLFWATGFVAASILANFFLWRQLLFELAPG